MTVTFAPFATRYIYSWTPPVDGFQTRAEKEDATYNYMLHLKSIKEEERKELIRASERSNFIEEQNIRISIFLGMTQKPERKTKKNWFTRSSKLLKYLK